jgi:hypothetical protein
MANSNSNRIPLLMGPNYNEWVLEAKAHLQGLGLRGVINGDVTQPLKPYIASSAEQSGSPTSTKEDPASTKEDPDKPD